MPGVDEIAIADKTNNNLRISLNYVMSPIEQKVSGIAKVKSHAFKSHAFK